MLPALAATSIQSRSLERFRRLRIRDIVAPAELLELLPSPFAHGLDELRVSVAHEVLKGIRLTVLLAHEEQRNVWGQEQERGREPAFRQAHQRGDAIAERTVAHLIVILNADHEPVRGNAGCRRAMAPLAMLGVPPIEYERSAQRRRDRGDAAEVGVVAVLLSGERGVDTVVQVVRPLAVEPVPTRIGGANHPRVVEVALADDNRLT